MLKQIQQDTKVSNDIRHPFYNLKVPPIPVTLRLHRHFLDCVLVNQHTVRDIKQIYRAAKKEMVFRPMFERKLAKYINRRAPKGSINWYKLRYEFRIIYQKCRNGQRPLNEYLKFMATFTEIAIQGNHKKIEIDRKSLHPIKR